MNSADDFQIVEVLNPRTSSDLFLIKKIGTEKLFIWRTILVRNMAKDKKETLCNKIRQRIQQDHPLLVKFHPVIEDDKLKLLYVPMDYFPQRSLFEFIKKLAKTDTTHINEEIIVKIIFQVLMLLKSIKVFDYMTLKNIYFDENFNVKFMNFLPYSTQTSFDIKMCDIGCIMMQICTLTTSKACNKYIVNTEYYSEEFIAMIEIMLKDVQNINVNIDKMIGHPVILLNTFKLNCGLKLNDCFQVLDYRTKLESLRKKEAALKAKEYKMEKIEHSLHAREKKITLCERTVRDKLTQAELYLKRCKENKTAHIHKYENVDNSLSAEYEELDCSDIIETSKKLNMDKLIKPTFIRTFSERKVRFKGHSPLKEMDFHRGKSSKKYKMNRPLFKELNLDKEPLAVNCERTESNLFKDISNTKKSLLKPVVKNDDKRRSTLFGQKSSMVQDENKVNMDCRPIAWTEESKKQAFDLLRIMNSTSDKQHLTGDVKHTYL